MQRICTVLLVLAFFTAVSAQQLCSIDDFIKCHVKVRSAIDIFDYDDGSEPSINLEQFGSVKQLKDACNTTDDLFTCINQTAKNCPEGMGGFLAWRDFQIKQKRLVDSEDKLRELCTSTTFDESFEQTLKCVNGIRDLGRTCESRAAAEIKAFQEGFARSLRDGLRGDLAPTGPDNELEQLSCCMAYSVVDCQVETLQEKCGEKAAEFKRKEARIVKMTEVCKEFKDECYRKRPTKEFLKASQCLEGNTRIIETTCLRNTSGSAEKRALEEKLRRGLGGGFGGHPGAENPLESEEFEKIGCCLAYKIVDCQLDMTKEMCGEDGVDVKLSEERFVKMNESCAKYRDECANISSNLDSDFVVSGCLHDNREIVDTTCVRKNLPETQAFKERMNRAFRIALTNPLAQNPPGSPELEKMGCCLSYKLLDCQNEMYRDKCGNKSIEMKLKDDLKDDQFVRMTQGCAKYKDECNQTSPSSNSDSVTIQKCVRENFVTLDMECAKNYTAEAKDIQEKVNRALSGALVPNPTAENLSPAAPASELQKLNCCLAYKVMTCQLDKFKEKCGNEAVDFVQKGQQFVKMNEACKNYKDECNNQNSSSN